jgi:hypothetical protein
MGPNTDKRGTEPLAVASGSEDLGPRFVFLRAFGIGLRLCVDHGPREYVSRKGAEKVERRKVKLR